MNDAVTLASVLKDLATLERQVRERLPLLDQAAGVIDVFQQTLREAHGDCAKAKRNTEETVKNLEDAQANLRRLEGLCGEPVSGSGVEFTIGPVSEKQ